MSEGESTSLRWSLRSWAVGIVQFGTFGYAAFILTLILLFRFAGEKWWVSGALIYVPPHVWLFPLLPLTILAYFFNRPYLFRLGGCLVLAVFGLCYFRISLPSSPRDGAPVIKVVINNIGESNGTSVDDFVAEQRPDLIVLQDAKRMTVEDAHLLYPSPDWNVKKEGAHVLISRFPIRASRLLPQQWRRSPGAVFNIDWNGRQFALYSIHLPTPRTEFLHLSGDIKRSKQYPKDSIQNLGRVEGFKSATQSRFREGKRLAELVAASPEPVLLVGDFNMPRWGNLYHEFSARFVDAFDARGFGFGFTVSGEAGNPLLLLGPWARIDYLFCSPSWRPLSCSVEPRRQSQHRAVVATFEWQDIKP